MTKKIHLSKPERVEAPAQTFQNIKIGVDNNAEFLRLPDVERLFGLKRSFVYKLERDGLLKSVTLRPRGSKHGVKLIATDSIRKMIASQGGW